jgi:tetratricopeptide (TPR) repeat protein
MRPAPLLILLVALATALTACAKRDAGTSAAAVRLEDGGTAVDIELMAFLSEARALHHEANVREDAGDLPGAIAAMQKLVGASRPHPSENLPEIDEVLADAFARLAELDLRAHDVDGARASIDKGLAHAPDATYFRGHLLEVSGIAEETRASILADAGKTDEAAKARGRALSALQQAVDVQEQVIGRALGDSGTGEGGRR